MLQLLILVVGILLIWIEQRTRLLTNRLGALEDQVGNYSRRLLASEGEVARLRQLVHTGADSPAPSPAVRPETAPPPAAPPAAQEAPPKHSVPPIVRQPARPAKPVAPPEVVTRPSSLITPVTPVTPVTPASPPSAFSAWVEAARAWLVGGNTVVRVGVVVLFFGVAFFLNYVVDRGWLPIELRLIAAALVGLGLLGTGWKLRDSRRDYGLVLQGGGVGIVYLTTFAAVTVYDVIGVGVGLGAMVVLVLLGAVLAVTQDARSLAVLATLGGFLGPVLVSSDGSHVALFSYYAALDVGIVAIAWFRAWRVLNVLGFVFTFIVGAAWGFEFYEPQYFATTQPFLAFFSVLFVAVPVLFAWRQPPRRMGYVDGTLVFGVPLAAFALQHRLASGFEYGPAWSALVLFAFYAVVAIAIRRRQPESMRLLVESFAALSIVFGTLMVPLAVDGRWTGAAWALEGAALVWIGVRQNRSLALTSGLALQFLAGSVFMEEGGRASSDLPLFNIVYLGSLMVSLSGLLSSRYLYQHRDKDLGYSPLSAGALGWGMLWWFGGGVGEISRHLSSFDQHSAILGFVAASVATIALLRQRLDWKHLAYPPFLLLPAMLVLTLTWLFTAAHPLARWGALAWPLSFVAQYWVLRRLEADWKRSAPVYHCGALWLGVFFLCWESLWIIEQLVPSGPTWPFVVWAVVPLAVALCLTRFGHRVSWSVRRFSDVYLGIGQLPLVMVAAGWVVIANFHRGDPQPLAYVPLLNPVELVQVGALGALLWWSVQSRVRMGSRERSTALGLLGFATLNGIIARATHFLGGVPFRADALWASGVVQTSASIAWTAVAFLVMFFATRLALRRLWWVGTALLGVVVIKLFSVDLADIGTVARIVSFVVVGGLILVIGYVSPMPPKEPARSD